MFCFFLAVRLGEDHRLNNRQTIFLEEHVLGAAQTDADRAVITGAPRILRIVGVGVDVQAAEFICPAEQLAQVGLAVEIGVDPLDFADEDFARAAVNRDRLAFMDNDVVDLEAAPAQVDVERFRAADAGDAELPRDDCRMAGRAAAAGQNTLGGEHPMNVIGLGFRAHHDDRAPGFAPFFGEVGVESGDTNCCAGGSVHAGGDDNDLRSRRASSHRH